MQAQKKKCPKGDCEYSRTIPISGKHCKISDCHTTKDVCCDIEQKNACYTDCNKEVKVKPVHLKIKPKKFCADAPHFDCKVNVKAECIKPGKAVVHGGNVLAKQDIFVEVFEPSVEYGKPTYKVTCHAPKCKIDAPKIEYTAGHVKVCPDIHIVHRKKPCKPHHKKKPHHGGKH